MMCLPFKNWLTFIENFKIQMIHSVSCIYLLMSTEKITDVRMERLSGQHAVPKLTWVY